MRVYLYAASDSRSLTRVTLPPWFRPKGSPLLSAARLGSARLAAALPLRGHSWSAHGASASAWRHGSTVHTVWSNRDRSYAQFRTRMSALRWKEGGEALKMCAVNPWAGVIPYVTVTWTQVRTIICHDVLALQMILRFKGLYWIQGFSLVTLSLTSAQRSVKTEKGVRSVQHPLEIIKYQAWTQPTLFKWAPGTG